jgi:hypothetical protein
MRVGNAPNEECGDTVVGPLGRKQGVGEVAKACDQGHFHDLGDAGGMLSLMKR